MALFGKKTQQNREARRAECLGALVMRTGLEQVVQKDGPAARQAHETLLNELVRWLERTGLREDQSPDERAMFAEPLGSWQAEEVIDASWRAESLGVIQWALRYVDALPPWDEPFDHQEVLLPLDLLGDPSAYESRALLRPSPEIEGAREVAELWHWRANASEAEVQAAAPPEGWTFEEMIATTAQEAFEDGQIPETIEDDFPVFGKPYFDLDEDEFTFVSKIAAERHLALNWLCGYSDNWDETPIET